MIKHIKCDIFESGADVICHQVNCQGVMGSGVALQIKEHYPHVYKEYVKYVNYCNKNGIELLGTVQYVPNEVWALIMVDTMKNNNIIAYDTNYQYIVNLFGQNTYGEGLQTDLKAMKKAFIDIREKAKKLGSTVAMPYKIGSVRGGADWNDVYNIIKSVFEKSDVNVELWRYDLG